MEERKDLTHFQLENKVKKEFKSFFNKWEELSLYAAKNKSSSGKRIRKGQLEVFYGYVNERIELATQQQLEHILATNHRRIKRLYITLDIEPYHFCKFSKEDRKKFNKKL